MQSMQCQCQRNKIKPQEFKFNGGHVCVPVTR